MSHFKYLAMAPTLHYRNPMKLIKVLICKVKVGDRVMTTRGPQRVGRIEQFSNPAGLRRIDLFYPFGILSGLDDTEVEVEVSDV